MNVTQCRGLFGTGLLAALLLALAFPLSLEAQRQTLFNVTVNESTRSNPNGNNAHDVVFWIDGTESPELTLVRGTTYRFVMNETPRSHPFYLSTSATGAGASPYNDGVTGQFAFGTDTLTFIPGANTPNLLYYQCQNHQYMGWKINVVGAPEDTLRFRALLAGDNEVPAVESRASGEVTATLVGNQLTLSGEFTGLRSKVLTALAGGAHLHRGYAGQNGSVEQPLTIMYADNDSTSGTFAAGSNTYTLTTSQRLALLNRQMYVNIHSTVRPGGELRGQLLPARAEVSTAVLSGRAEIPANRSRASGGVVIERYGDTIILSGSFTGLETPLARNIGGGAHIHLGDHDTNGPVLRPLKVVSPDGADTSGILLADSNTFVLGGNAIEEFTSLGTYINVHSSGRTGGEIRGQVVPHDAVVFEAWLAGINEVPPMPTTAGGGVIAILDGRTLLLGGAYAGLTSDLAVEIAGGAHVHRGGPEGNGPVLRPLSIDTVDARNGAFRVESNTFVLTPGGIDSLHDGMLYVNVHSVDRRGGELRGQLLPSVNVPPTPSGLLSPAPGASVSIPSDTAERLTARWRASTDRNGNLITYTWQIAADTGFAMPLFTTPSTTDTTFSLSFGEILTRLDEAGIDPSVVGPLTVNHRVIASDGSLWSVSRTEQLTIGEPQVGDNGYRAVLAGHNEVPAAESRGSGMISARLVGDTLKVSGSFRNLGSPVATAIQGGAHIHQAPAGRNGPIVVGLTMSLDNDQRGGTLSEGENSFVLTADQITALNDRRMYINIHSTGIPSGELRGQLLPSGSVLYRTNLSGRAELPPNRSDGLGTAILEVRGDTIAFSGGFAELGSDLMPIAGSAAHIHAGGIDTNGPVLLPLQILPGSGVQGRFATLSAVAPPGLLSPARLDSAGLYVNVHTTAFAGGELRGQIVSADNEIMEAWLAPQNEVRQSGDRMVVSGATGSVIAILDSNRLRLGGSFDGLSSPFRAAHIHMGAPGTNGGVEITLNATTGSGGTGGKFSTALNSYLLTRPQIDALLDGRMYVNVHSADYPGGEIRGQLLVSTNLPPQSPSLLRPLSGDTITLGSELTGSLDVLAGRGLDPNGNQVVYALQFSSTASFDAGATVTVPLSDTAVPIPHAAIGAITDSLGIAPDDDGEPLWTRLIISDGSLWEVGATVVLTVRTDVSSVTGEADRSGLLELTRVVPNPLVRQGEIRMRLGAPATVRLEIYDESGRQRAQSEVGMMAPGEHRLPLTVGALPSGTYHYRVIAESGEQQAVAVGLFTLLR